MPSSINAAVSDFYARYAQFQGRSSVGQYWWVVLFMAIVALVFSFFILMCEQGSFFYWVWTILEWAWGLFNLIPSLALAVRRLHDTGRGGGWIFISLVPIIGSVWFIILMILSGQPEENRFGYPVS